MKSTRYTEEYKVEAVQADYRTGPYGGTRVSPAGDVDLQSVSIKSSDTTCRKLIGLPPTNNRLRFANSRPNSTRDRGTRHLKKAPAYFAKASR